MDLNKILEYQKLDSQLVKIERQLKDNANKKNASKRNSRCLSALFTFCMKQKATHHNKCRHKTQQKEMV